MDRRAGGRMRGGTQRVPSGQQGGRWEGGRRSTAGTRRRSRILGLAEVSHWLRSFGWPIPGPYQRDPDQDQAERTDAEEAEQNDLVRGVAERVNAKDDWAWVFRP